MDGQLLTRDLYGGQSQSGGKESGSPLSYYLGVLRRRIWVVLPVVVVATTIGILKVSTAPKIFEARTRLLVERDSPQIIPLSGGFQDAARQDADYYTTQRELILSRAVLELALTYPDVREPLQVGEEAAASESSFLGELKRSLVAVLGARPAPPEMLWERLRKKLTVEHIPESHFIEIRARSRDADYAAAAANAVAAAYQQYHLNRQAENLSQDFILLQKEKEREEKALLEAEQELQAFRERAQGLSASVSPEDQPVIERLMKLNEQLTSVQLKRIELASQIAVMKEAVDPAHVRTLAPDERLFSIPVVQGNDVLMTVRKSLVEAEKELGVLSTTYGTEHPLYQASLAKVELLRRQFVTTLGEIVLAQMNRLKMLEQEEAQLQQSVEEQKRTALELAKEAFTLARLQSAVERHRTLFDAIVARMREVNVSSGLIRTNVQVVERASVPLQPVDSGRWRVILVAIGIGLFLGCGLGLVFEHLDDTVKTPEDLREKLGLPLLGFVPSINLSGETRALEEKPSGVRAPGVLRERGVPGIRRHGFLRFLRRLDPAARLEEEMDPDPSSPQERAYRGAIMLHEPVSSTSEAYRSLRANLFYAMPADEIKVLAVTSCRPREGKTTTATNLALAIAQTGKRVLLVDADLHRPALDLTLGVVAAAGLTTVLVGERRWQESVSKLVHNGKPVENLDVLVAGPPSPNPSELLGSNAMKNFLAEVRRQYEWVIVDTPPVLFVSDATILGAMCDGVVLVVKAGMNTRTMLLRAREQLAAVHARIIGVVLNQAVLSTMGRYYSTYYTYGYSRYARDYRRYGRAPDSPRRKGFQVGTAGRSEQTPTLMRQQHRLAALEKAALEKAGVHSAQGEAEQASIILEAVS
ncbi:MAG: polysaccharide biosynthesis tyrosine autokinase, partial [Kiritimatiellae bacterium]|nr:polysaccharide biosynthesis tyrosine autokinase [Kiritimatiellia bacterium]